MNKYYKQFLKISTDIDKIAHYDFMAGIYFAMSSIYDFHRADFDWSVLEEKVKKDIDKAYDEGILNE